MRHQAVALSQKKFPRRQVRGVLQQSAWVNRFGSYVPNVTDIPKWRRTLDKYIINREGGKKREKKGEL